MQTHQTQSQTSRIHDIAQWMSQPITCILEGQTEMQKVFSLSLRVRDSEIES